MGPVFIAGMGISCALGLGTSRVEQRLRESVSGIRQGSSGYRANLELDSPVNLEGVLADAGVGEELRLDEKVSRAVSRGKRWSNRSSNAFQMTLSVALEAWLKSLDYLNEVNSDRLGLVLSGGWPGVDFLESESLRMQEQPGLLHPRLGYAMWDTHLSGAIADMFEINGYGLNVGGASASGAIAVAEGARLVRSGEVEACLVVCPMKALSEIEWAALGKLGVLASMEPNQDTPPGPCDRQSRGLVPGEGCVALVLISELLFASAPDSVKSRSACALVGQANIQSATAGPEPSSGAEASCFRKTLDSAGWEAEDVDYISLHATGTPAGDQAEVRALQLVFDFSNGKGPALNASKGTMGHTWTAAGGIGAVVTALQLGGRFLHPNWNLTDPIDPDLPWVMNTTQPFFGRRALSMAYGFGGVHVGLAMEWRPGSHYSETKEAFENSSLRSREGLR